MSVIALDKLDNLRETITTLSDAACELIEEIRPYLENAEDIEPEDGLDFDEHSPWQFRVANNIAKAYARELAFPEDITIPVGRYKLNLLTTPGGHHIGMLTDPDTDQIYSVYIN